MIGKLVVFVQRHIPPGVKEHYCPQNNTAGVGWGGGAILYCALVGCGGDFPAVSKGKGGGAGQG